MERLKVLARNHGKKNMTVNLYSPKTQNAYISQENGLTIVAYLRLFNLNIYNEYI